MIFPYLRECSCPVKDGSVLVYMKLCFNNMKKMILFLSDIYKDGIINYQEMKWL